MQIKKLTFGLLIIQRKVYLIVPGADKDLKM